MKHKKALLVLAAALMSALAAFGLSACGGSHLEESLKREESLSFEFHETYYTVVGKGNCTDTDIVIPSVYEGKPVTSIGERAFAFCSGLTSIVIPDSVTTIGSGAFSGCSSLENITIPFVGAKAGVTSTDTYQYPFGHIFGTSSYTGGIATYQYYYGSSTSDTTCSGYCIPSSLKSVTVTGGNILRGAFDNCSGLTSVTIGNGVTSIGDSAFSGCSGLTSIAIPDSVTIIGNGAFRGCSGLTGIVLPDSVTSIGDSAFFDCSGLTSIVIPDSVTIIGNGAFRGCSGLTSATIGNGVTSIGDSAFSGCSGLTSIAISDSVTIIGNGAFRGCSGLTSIAIPDGVTTIGYEAFSDCRSLTSIVIPDSVTTIAKGVFVSNNEHGVSFYCRIEKATVPASAIGYIPRLNLKTVIITSGDSIEDCAFEDCSGLISIVIPDSVTSIGERAFRDCTGLTSIVIPDSVTSIGSSAFEGCTGLTSIVIPDSVTSIGSEAFKGCYKLVEVYNLSPLNITKGSEENGGIGYYAKNIYTSLTEPSKLSTDEDGYIIYTDGENKILIAYTGMETALTLPEGITEIYRYAFENCSSLTSIVIPGSVTSIGSFAFSFCCELTSIVIPDSIMSIGEYAFSNCCSLTSIVIPDGVTSIGEGAFEGCYGLTSVTLGNGVTNIGKWAFFDCSGLTSIVIPDSVTNIGSGAFENCSELTSVTLGNGVTSIDGSAFFNCPIENVHYLGTIDEWCAFATTSFLSVPGRFYFWDGTQYYEPTEVTVPPDKVSCLQYISSITEITVSYVETEAIPYCDFGLFPSLTSLKLEFFESELNANIPEGTQVIYGYNVENGEYNGFTYLRRGDSINLSEYKGTDECVVLPSAINGVAITYLSNVFEGNAKVKRIIVPEGYTEIAEKAFYNCTALEIVYLPSTLTSIGANAFYNNNMMPYIIDASFGIKVSPFVTAIAGAGYTFSGEYGADAYITGGIYTPLSSAFLSASVSCTDKSYYIHYENFFDAGTQMLFCGTGSGKLAVTGYCGKETNLTIPVTVEGKSVESVYYYAFYNCTFIKSVVIPEGITSLIQSAFDGCSGLESVSLPQSLEDIAGGAFRNCSSLASIVIPKGVTVIGTYVFEGCVKLVSVRFEQSNWMLIRIDENGEPVETKEVDVSNPQLNASNLIGTYCSWAWLVF